MTLQNFDGGAKELVIELAISRAVRDVFIRTSRHEAGEGDVAFRFTVDLPSHGAHADAGTKEEEPPAAEEKKLVALPPGGGSVETTDLILLGNTTGGGTLERGIRGLVQLREEVEG